MRILYTISRTVSTGKSLLNKKQVNCLSDDDYFSKCSMLACIFLFDLYSCWATPHFLSSAFKVRGLFCFTGRKETIALSLERNQLSLSEHLVYQDSSWADALIGPISIYRNSLQLSFEFCMKRFFNENDPDIFFYTSVSLFWVSCRSNKQHPSLKHVVLQS